MNPFLAGHLMDTTEIATLFLRFSANLTDYGWTDRGFTDSISGYIRSAAKEVRLILRNADLDTTPQCHVNINIDEELTLECQLAIWKNIKRALAKRKIHAYWVAEACEDLKTIHYHMLVRLNFPIGEVESRIRASIPSNVKHHIHIAPIKTTLYTTACYILKAKREGQVKGKHREDIYKWDRRFFLKGLYITKVGTIGRYFVRSKQVLWQEITEYERALAAVKTPELLAEAERRHKLVEQEYKYKDIERDMAKRALEKTKLLEQPQGDL